MSAIVRYVLVSNSLTEADDFRARVLPTRTATIEEVADHIIEQGSTVTRSDVLSVLEGYDKAVLHMVLEEGVRVKTSLVTFWVSIKGVFVDEEDGFDPKRHQVVCRVKPGARMREALGHHQRAERQRVAGHYPDPLGYRDVTTGERNGAVTPGGMAKLTGDWLRFDPDDERQGVFFIASDGTRSRVTALAENLPTRLIFQAPADLAPGEYRLRVRNEAGGKILHRNRTEILLTV